MERNEILTMPKFVVSNECVLVSSYFIENCLKDASGIFVKVYLYALNLAEKGINQELSSIAQALDILESDVLQAFTYWKNIGMIIEENGIVEFCNTPITEAVQAIPSVQKNIQDTDSVKKSYDSLDIAKSISENQELSELVMLSQELLAKPLTSSELETIYWLYDGLGFSTEAILLITDYCITKEKRSVKYIEKVAIAWHEKGIKSPEQIMECISLEEQQNQIVFKLKKSMGINDRALSNAEEQYILKWYNELKTSEDMILLAYEYCLLNTSKLSFPYMDKIITGWSEQGITTKEDAENAKRSFKKGAKKTVFDDSFNHTDLEKLTRKN